jgi:hypothetical protein
LFSQLLISPLICKQMYRISLANDIISFVGHPYNASPALPLGSTKSKLTARVPTFQSTRVIIEPPSSRLPILTEMPLLLPDHGVREGEPKV